MRSREIVIALACLVVGLVAGFFTANSLNRDGTPPGPESPLDQTQSATVRVPTDGMQADVTTTLSAAESDPQNFAAQMKAGDMYAQIGRFEKAIEFYKRGVVINPANFQANVVLANALFDSQKFLEAETYYSRALQIEPNNVDARTDLGTTFVERPQPDYARAIEEFRKARQADPKHLPSLYYIGIASLRSGDRVGAVRILKELEEEESGTDLAGRLRQNIEATSPTIQ